MKKFALLLFLARSALGSQWNALPAEDLHDLYRSSSPATREVIQKAVTTLNFSHTRTDFEYGSNTTCALLKVFPNVTTLSEENPTTRWGDAPILSGPKDFYYFPKTLTTLKLRFPSYINVINNIELEALPQGLQELDLSPHSINLDCAFLPRYLTRLSLSLDAHSSTTIKDLPETLTTLTIWATAINQLDFSHLKNLKTLTSYNRGTNISLHTLSLPKSITSLGFSADVCTIPTSQLLNLTSLTYEGPSSLSSFIQLKSLTSLSYNDWFGVVNPQDLTDFTSLTTLKINDLANSDMFAFLPRTLREFIVRAPLRNLAPDFTNLPKNLNRLHFGGIPSIKHYKHKKEEDWHFFLHPHRFEALPSSITDLILEDYEFIRGERYLLPSALTKFSFKGFSKNEHKFPADFFPKSLTFFQMTDVSPVEKDIIEALPKGLKTLITGPIVPENLPPALTYLGISHLHVELTAEQVHNFPRDLNYLEIGSLPKISASAFKGLPKFLKTLILFFNDDLSLKQFYPYLPKTLETLSLTKLDSERIIRRGKPECIITEKSKFLKNFYDYLKQQR